MWRKWSFLRNGPKSGEVEDVVNDSRYDNTIYPSISSGGGPCSRSRSLRRACTTSSTRRSILAAYMNNGQYLRKDFLSNTRLDGSFEYLNLTARGYSSHIKTIMKRTLTLALSYKPYFFISTTLPVSPSTPHECSPTACFALSSVSTLIALPPAF